MWNNPDPIYRGLSECSLNLPNSIEINTWELWDMQSNYIGRKEELYKELLTDYLWTDHSYYPRALAKWKACRDSWNSYAF